VIFLWTHLFAFAFLRTLYQSTVARRYSRLGQWYTRHRVVYCFFCKNIFARSTCLLTYLLHGAESYLRS